MSMRRPKPTPIHLFDAERQGVEKLINQHTIAQQIGLRAKFVLAAAQETPNVHIAKNLEVTMDMVRLWWKHWLPYEPLS